MAGKYSPGKEEEWTDHSYLNPFVIMASGRSDDSTSLLLI